MNGKHKFSRRGVVASALGVVAAGGLALGLALPGFAGASSSIVGDSHSKDVAGYSTTRWTRFVTASTVLPSNALCVKLAASTPDGAGEAITVGPAEESNAGVSSAVADASTVGLSFVPSATGCGLISPSFATNVGAAPGAQNSVPLGGNLNPQPGDNVTETLFYSQGGHFTSAVVTDNTNGTTSHGSFDGAATYEGSSATAGFGPFTQSPIRYRAWEFKGVHLTTYTGHQGLTMSNEIVMTSNGAASGTVEADAPNLWGLGENYGVYVH